MKTLVSLSMVLCFAAVCMSASYAARIDEQLVPPQVQTDFRKKFPHARNVKWKYKEVENKHDAVFFDGKVKIEATYINLRWVATEYEILPYSALPLKARAYIKLRYRGFTVAEVDKCERPNSVVYTVKMARGIGELEVDFDSAGNFLREAN